MNDEQFNDPLADFDPVMESAFSNATEQVPVQAEPEPVTDPEPVENDATTATEPEVTDDISNDDAFFSDEESFDIDETLFEEKQDPDGVSVSAVNFESPQNSVSDNQTYDKNLFKNIKVDVSIELGRTKISLKKLYELKSGSIIEMARLVGEPLDLVINDQVIARGEVVAVNSNYGIRITHIESLNNIT
jgi:flagellar motor switch protein FliN/FliY